MSVETYQDESHYIINVVNQRLSVIVSLIELTITHEQENEKVE